MVIALIVKIKLFNYLRNSPPFTKTEGKSHLDKENLQFDPIISQMKQATLMGAGGGG
jgi:hypothetical protein